MNLLEALKKQFFRQPKEKEDLSIPLNHPAIDNHLGDDLYAYNASYGFFDADPFYGTGQNGPMTLITAQNNLVREYRKTASLPECSNAIDEIINEIAYVHNNEETVYIDFSEKLEMNDKIKDAIIKSFDEVTSILDFNYNVDALVRRWYVDGFLVAGVAYDQKKTKKGIAKISILSPFDFYYDSDLKVYRYADKSTIGSTQTKEQILQKAFMPEEIVKIDCGLYDGDVTLSHLQSAIKIANQLQTIEDLVIPLRFSRSIARRVFNVDVGDLPPAKVRQEMESIKREYKYKKYYDVEKGTMSNSTSVSSIVEDYWFPNRGGRGGTTVDVMNETGGANFGDMGDAEYFRNKLYEALKVPTGRLNGAGKTAFDFSASAIEHDEQRFFAFVNRLRQRFNVFLLELLRRQLAAKNVMSNLEFDRYKSFINIKWAKENNYTERENIEIFKSRLELYASIKEFEGDIYSRKYLLKNILKMSDEEIDEQKQQIKDELKDKIDQEDEDINTSTDDSEEDETPIEEPEDEEETPVEEPEEDETKDDKDFGTNFNAKGKE